MRSILFGSKDRSHSLVYQPLRITLSFCVCGFSPRSLKTIPCGETIYQVFCLYTSSLLRCHRASPPYFIVPPSSSFSLSLQPPLTACLIVFVCVHCILNALSRELTFCAVESQTDYLPCLGSQYNARGQSLLDVHVQPKGRLRGQPSRGQVQCQGSRRSESQRGDDWNDELHVPTRQRNGTLLSHPGESLRTRTRSAAVQSTALRAVQGRHASAPKGNKGVHLRGLCGPAMGPMEGQNDDPAGSENQRGHLPESTRIQEIPGILCQSGDIGTSRRQFTLCVLGDPDKRSPNQQGGQLHESRDNRGHISLGI